MPLIYGKSDKAFDSNVREMVDSGHPLKTSLAAAYNEKKKAERRRKLWAGGEIEPDQMSESDLEENVSDAGEESPTEAIQPVPFAQALKRRRR